MFDSFQLQLNLHPVGERLQCYLVILKDKYTNYESALSELKLETLFKRREMLCLKFAKFKTTKF